MRRARAGQAFPHKWLLVLNDTTRYAIDKQTRHFVTNRPGMCPKQDMGKVVTGKKLGAMGRCIGNGPCSANNSSGRQHGGAAPIHGSSHATMGESAAPEGCSHPHDWWTQPIRPGRHAGRDGKPLAADKARRAKEVCETRNMDSGTSTITTAAGLPTSGDSWLPVLYKGAHEDPRTLLLGWQPAG